MKREVEKFVKNYDGKFKESFLEVYQVMTKSLPKEMEAVLIGDMVKFQLPLKIYSDTYNKQPLMYASLSARKANLTVTLTGIFNDEVLKTDFLSAVKKVNPKLVTKTSCIKFKKTEDLPLADLGKIMKRLNTKRFLKNYESLMKKLKS